jgi:antitoxin CcdA
MRIRSAQEIRMNARSPSPKRAANVSVRSDLLEQARRHDINLSRALEERLVELLREKQRDAWLLRNRAAIDAYNKRVERDGVFSDGLRSF